jgi:hypothetical protein
MPVGAVVEAELYLLIFHTQVASCEACGVTFALLISLAETSDCMSDILEPVSTMNLRTLIVGAPLITFRPMTKSWTACLGRIRNALPTLLPLFPIVFRGFQPNTA